MAEIASNTNKMEETCNGKNESSSPITSEQVSEAENTDDSQIGVRRIEAISQTWSKRALIVAYIRSDRISFG